MHIPGLINLKHPEEAHSLRAGGHVLLMGAFCIGEDVAIIDYSDDYDNIAARWNDAVNTFLGELPENDAIISFIGKLGDLKEASRHAIGAQMSLALQLQHEQKYPDGEMQALKQVAFYIDETINQINLVGLFEDNSEVILIKALPMEGLMLIEDVSLCMGLDEAAHILIEGMPRPWANTVESVAPETSLAIKPKGNRLH